MAYEIKFHYFEEIEKGEYNKEIKKEKTIKIGSLEEEISLKNVALKIFSQLARRNILIFDVEIYEYTKKKLSYKETDDGILIKNRKFKFDGDDYLVTEEYSNQQSVEEKQKSNYVSSINNINKKVIRYEVYDPLEDSMVKDSKRRGYKFTLGKKYEIIAERDSGNDIVGYIYTTIDDAGNQVMLSERFFTSDVNLQFSDNEFVPRSKNKSNSQNFLNLNDGFTDEYDMVEIRK